jgi:predicted transcriptional regulator
MTKLIRVEGEQNLYRDASSGAIINTDAYEYSQYIAQKERRKKERDEINELKNELSEIKTLLKQMLKNES